MNRMMVVLALGCALQPAGAQKVRVDFDRASNFSKYRTYQWQVVPDDDQDVNQLMQRRLTRFIDEALAARKLKRVDCGGDLVVSYQTTVTERDDVTTFTNGGWGSAISYTTVQPVFLGTLTITLTDARNNHLVFEGVSRNTLRSRPEKNTKRFASGVRKIFEKYPQ